MKRIDSDSFCCCVFFFFFSFLWNAVAVDVDVNVVVAVVVDAATAATVLFCFLLCLPSANTIIINNLIIKKQNKKQIYVAFKMFQHEKMPQLEHFKLLLLFASFIFFFFFFFFIFDVKAKLFALRTYRYMSYMLFVLVLLFELYKSAARMQLFAVVERRRHVLVRKFAIRNQMFVEYFCAKKDIVV